MPQDDYDRLGWTNIPIGGPVVVKVLLRQRKRTWRDMVPDLLCRVGLHHWEPWDDDCPECAGIDCCRRCGEMRPA